MNDIKTIKSKLKDSKMKITPQRIAIIEFILKSENHLCAEEIFKNMKKKFTSLSFATIYNTLNMLVEIGELVEISITPDKRYFDKNVDIHSNIICIECGKIYDIEKDYSNIINLDRKDKKEFPEVLGYQIYLYGRCSNCFNKQKK